MTKDDRDLRSFDEQAVVREADEEEPQSPDPTPSPGDRRESPSPAYELVGPGYSGGC